MVWTKKHCKTIAGIQPAKTREHASKINKIIVKSAGKWFSSSMKELFLGLENMNKQAIELWLNTVPISKMYKTVIKMVEKNE